MEASVDWDDAKIKAANFNSGALNALFSVVTSQMRSSRRFTLLKLQKKHGPSSIQLMKELRLSRIQNFKGLL